jgi:dephospho-CoA kinase
VRSAWREMVRDSRDQQWLLLDIPLLFETEAEKEMDHTVVVACSPSTQRRRLREVRGLQDGVAEKIIAAQMDLDLKIRKADHVVWNDSSIESLRAQAHLLAQHFLRTDG